MGTGLFSAELAPSPENRPVPIFLLGDGGFVELPVHGGELSLRRDGPEAGGEFDDLARGDRPVAGADANRPLDGLTRGICDRDARFDRADRHLGAILDREDDLSLRVDARLGW